LSENKARATRTVDQQNGFSYQFMSKKKFLSFHAYKAGMGETS